MNSSTHGLIELITISEVILLLKCSRMSLYRMRKRSDFPLPIKINGGTHVRWNKNTILDWLKK